MTAATSVPTGNPTPGQPGGGASPQNAPQETLALVPAGLTPVATFPPYNTPRTFPAQSVIFLENSNPVKRRKKRGIFEGIQYGFKIFMKNLKCLSTRLKYRYLKQNDETTEVRSARDCVIGLPEPLYGLVVNITIIEDQECTLGSTCSQIFNQKSKLDGFYPNFKLLNLILFLDFFDNYFSRRQGNQIFLRGRPQCRFRRSVDCTNRIIPES